MSEAKIKLNVFKVVDDYRRLNGLVFDDYMRYRQYCSRRIARIKRNRDIKCAYRGKKDEYCPRDFLKELQQEGEEQTPDQKKELKALHVHIILLQAERAWSYAMQLKQEMEADGVENGVRSRHMLKRLKKATYWSEHLHEICKHVGDDGTVLQTDAYSTLLNGTYFLEMDNLEKAMLSFSSAIQQLESIEKTANAEDKEIIKKKKENADFLLVYCKRYLSQEGVDVSKLLEANANLPMNSKLKKMNEDMAILRVNEEGSLLTVFDEQISVGDKNIAAKLLTASDAFSSFVSEVDGEWEKVENRFTETVSKLDEIIALSGLPDNVSKLVKKVKSNLTAKKNLALVRKLVEAHLISEVKTSNPENIVRLCDKIPSTGETKFYKAYSLGCFYLKEGLNSGNVENLSMAATLFNKAVASEEDELQKKVEERSKKLKMFCIGKIGLIKENKETKSEKKTVIKTQSVAMKPFFLDLVNDDLRPENLELEVKETKKESKPAPVEKRSQPTEKEMKEKGWFGTWFK